MTADFFFLIFGVLVVVCGFLQWVIRQRAQPAASKEEQEPEQLKKAEEEQSSFRRFQWNYLLVYLIVMEADWLQGPYVYALYEAYGFVKQDIAILFIAGFSSSMVFGTFIGSIADKYGRKNMCMVFGLCYSLSCLTKLFNDFNILLAGRILAGISTSLLFSAFEAWMVYEHFKRGYSAERLSSTFSMATIGNGLAAIVAGLIASFVAEIYGFVAPFMVALCFLILATVIVASTWSENYGDSTINVSQTFSNAVTILRNDPKVPILGLTQSLFEGSMYVFVFMWTPALNEDPNAIKDQALPYGVIFACFMVCIMVGSSIFTLLVQKSIKLESIALVVLGFALVSLSVPIFAVNQYVLLLAFLAFEVSCGLYFPCFGTLRGTHIPESARATIMNFFRVPLNFLVVVVLRKVDAFSNQTVFAVCAAWLITSLVLAKIFGRYTAGEESKRKGSDLELSTINAVAKEDSEEEAYFQNQREEARETELRERL
jgi:MFS family permease